MVPIKIENQMDKKMELDMARAGIVVWRVWSR